MLKQSLFLMVILLILPIAFALNQTLEELDAECAKQLECNETNGEYFFDCHFNEQLGECRCFTGDFSKCNASDEADSSVAAAPPGESFFSRAKWYAISVYDAAKNTPFWVKIAALTAVIVILLGAYYLVRSEMPDKDLSKARRYHRIATKAHDKGKEEKAEKYYELANYHRERAHENET